MAEPFRPVPAPTALALNANEANAAGAPGAPAAATRAPSRRAALLLAGFGALALGGCIMVPVGHRQSRYPQQGAGPAPGRPPYGDDDDDDVIAAPPAPQVDIVVASPGPGYFWIGGYWAWQFGRHVWIGGQWQPQRRGYSWVPHSWERHPRGWRARPGRWQRR